MPIEEDWRFKNECFPFQDEDNYYIVVDSEYETPGNEKETRLAEARTYGVFKLLQFYGKDTSASILDGIDRVAVVEDWYVAYRPCVRMKVLISVPKSEFNLVPDDPNACTIEIPEEGYISAIVPVAYISSIIEEVVSHMKSLMPKLVLADNYITNVNIGNEIKRLSRAGRAIQRYINLNKIPSSKIEDPECVQPDEDTLFMEIGFSLDYKPIFALVDPEGEREQYTIGYHCLLDNANLNHITTVNYLINIQNMLFDLRNKNDINFNYLSFLTSYTLPTPILRPKSQLYDGVNKYDENGNLFTFANLAKLIALDLDVNLCKTDEEKREEDRLLQEAEARAAVAAAAKQTEDEVGNELATQVGVEALKKRIEEYADTNDVGKNSAAVKLLWEDVLGKIDFACTLEETIQCILENTITAFGEEVFNDPDLERVINIKDVSLGGYNNNCEIEKCDGTFSIDAKIGFPVFQGISIPTNLPISKDFYSEILNDAIVQLYNTILSSMTSFILGILEGLCELLFTLPDGISMIGDGFKNWLSSALGISVDQLNDADVWKEALTTSGGGGLIGVIGAVAAKTGGAFVDAYTETGISLNVPNPETGQVEEKFISPEFIVTFFSETSRAVEEVETVCTPSEYQALYKGCATVEVSELAFKCVTRNGSEIFDSRQTFEDVFLSLGDLLQPPFLLQQIQEQPEVASDVCDLQDQVHLRKSILSQKDADLSGEEIDEIINKEKQRKKKKLLDAIDTLNQYKAGALAPSFPDLFGKNGLIKEMPEPILKISELAIGAGLQSSHINFITDASNYYTRLWGQLYGVDEEGEELEELNSVDPKDIYNHFRGQYSQENTDTAGVGAYQYGYSSKVLDNIAEEVLKEEELQEGLISFANGKETYIYQNFGKNFKKSEFQDELAETFFDGYPSQSQDTFDAILDFIEDKDEENGTHAEIFFDAENPLISYSVVVYHEGGLTDIGTDRLTEAILIKTEYSEDDQVETKEVVYNYGEYFGTTDKSNLTDKLADKDWEGPLNGDTTVQEGIVKLANNDIGGFIGAFALGSGAAAGGAAYLLSGPLWSGLYSAGLALTIGPLMGSKAALIATILTGGIAAVVATAILVAISLIAVYYDGKDIAKRIVYPEPQGGFVYVYDIIVSDKKETVIVRERRVKESLVIRTESLKSPDWPNDIVKYRKTSEVPYISSTSNNNRLTEYVQDYTYGTTTSFNLGIKQENERLTPISFPCDNDENTDQLEAILRYDNRLIPTSQKALAQFVHKSLNINFPDVKNNSIISDIVDEIINGSASNRFGFYDDPVSEKLVEDTMSQLIDRIQDNSDEKYWTPGYTNGNFYLIDFATDILNYSNLKSDFQALNQELYNATINGDYCDNLPVIRRINSCQSLIFLIRLYIVEQAMVSIQVCDKYDLEFMDSEIFATNTLSLLYNDTVKYRESFSLDVDIYSDILEVSQKYYEILTLLGIKEQIPAKTQADYLIDIIRQETKNLKSSIVNTLNLQEKWKNWDGFVNKRAIPTYDAPSNVEKDATQVYFTMPPDNATYSYYERYGENYPGNFPPTKENLRQFAENALDEAEEANTFYKSLAGGIPEAELQELKDKLFDAADNWFSAFESADIEADLLKAPADGTGSEVRKLVDTIEVSSIFGDYTANYEFIITTQYRADTDPTYYDPNNPEAGVSYKPRVDLDIIVQFDGNLTPDYEEVANAQGILDPFSNYSGGFMFERYVDYKEVGKDNIIVGFTSFLTQISSQISNGTIDRDKSLFDIYEYIRFGYRMVYIVDPVQTNFTQYSFDGDKAYHDTATLIPELMDQLEDIAQVSEKQKAFSVNGQIRYFNEELLVAKYYSFPIANAECEYVDTTKANTGTNISVQEFLDTIQEKYNTDIYENIKTALLETDEYKIVINDILTLKEIISSLCIYQYAALSDEDVFRCNIEGLSLHDIASRAKLSTLQTFYASIYGGGKISYQDPFTKDLNGN